MNNKIPRWLPVGEHGAVLKDAAGLVYGAVCRSSDVPMMWIGTAVNVPATTFELFTGPADASAGVRHYAPSKEKAMDFVVEALQKAGRL